MAAAVGGMTTSEAARALGVASETVRTWARQRRVRAVETPHGLLFDEDDVHRLAEQRDRAAREKPRRRGGR